MTKVYDCICRALVAMANAQPEVKEVADYITTSNDEDGVALVIDRFM